jgi:hypothetical protein
MKTGSLREETEKGIKRGRLSFCAKSVQAASDGQEGKAPRGFPHSTTFWCKVLPRSRSILANSKKGEKEWINSSGTCVFGFPV